MRLPASASDMTEAIRSSAQANGALSQAARASAGRPVKRTAGTAIPSRPISALGAIVRASEIARSIGFAPSTNSVPTPGVSLHTGIKSTITVSPDSYDLYTFLTTGINTFVVQGASVIGDIFVLGGGGPGAAGGGGGGGLAIFTNVTIPPSTYTITVGEGGATGANKDIKGTNGGDSSITVSGTVYKGEGGGAGASYAGVANSGGCGGGGGANNASGAGSGTQGFGGATSNNPFANGGGGGMGGAGSWVTGGAGLASSFSGTSITYGGGGAGAADPGYCPCNPGSGGGGGLRANGTDGLGGGGGGAYYSGQFPGRGGHGRVMIRIRK